MSISAASDSEGRRIAPKIPAIGPTKQATAHPLPALSFIGLFCDLMEFLEDLKSIPVHSGQCGSLWNLFGIFVLFKLT